MITKLALLTRILPGLFRRLPTVTSAGYTMPRERFFFFGVSFSAVLHAAVLFGFNPPKPPPPPAGPEISITKVVRFDLPPEDPPPPPEPDPDVKNNPAGKKAAEVGEDYSRLPTPTLPSINPSIIIPGEKLDAGKVPNKDNLRWNPPATPAGPGVGKGTGPIFNKDDLDKVPVATNRTSPRYPFEMKNEGRTGTVVLRFVVDSRGDVTDVEVVSSPHSAFSRAAVEAMLKWKFRPGVKDFKKVNTRMEMPMAFSLEKSS